MVRRLLALMIVVFVGIVGFHWTAPQSYAGNCRIVTTHNGCGTGNCNFGYVAPVYGHSGGFLQAYPKLLEVQRVDAVYSSGQYLQNQALLKALDTIDKLNAQLKGGSVGNAGGTGKLLPAEVEEILQGIPTPKFASSSNPDVLQSVVNAKCLSCHDGKRQVMDLTDLTKLSEKDKVAVRDSVADGTMPPKGKEPLTAEEARRFRHLK